MCIGLPNGHHMHKHYTAALFMRTQGPVSAVCVTAEEELESQ